MRSTFTLIASLGLASAFPTAIKPRDHSIMRRAISAVRRSSDPIGISKAQGNCGTIPCTTFDESQLVSIIGDHAYAAPSESDIRGPCPGLNAAANHGYLPRNGLASITQTITGLGEAYGMSPDLALFLAAYGVAIDGNLAQGLWSIGGPLPADDLTGALLGTGQGISYSHNNYEGDASIGRSDAYVNNGDAHSLNVSRFEEVYSLGGSEDRYTMDKFRQQFGSVQQYSIDNNPYYFTGAFSTVLVVPAAYNFVINFMSNHSAEEPSGYLNGDIFKQFFAVSGEPGNFVWNRGQERIPENWYRRPLDNEYDIATVLTDLATGFVAYPETLKIGGNVGKVDSFVGVDLNNLTSNTFGIETLFEGDNFACFVTALAQQAIPDFLNPLVEDIADVVSSVRNALTPFLNSIDCPQIGQYDFTFFDQFPGYKYSPTGPATNY